MNRTTLKYIILTISIIGVFTSCEYIHNLMDEGDISEQIIHVGEVNQIIADASCRIVLHNNESEVVFIKGINRLIENLDLNNDGGTLTISHSKKAYLQKSKLIEIGLSARHLNRITANMAIELEAPETIIAKNFVLIMNGGAKFAEIDLSIDCDNLTLNVYGNNNIGNYYLRGNSNTSSFNLEGSVNIDALALESSRVQVQHKSIGSCKVRPASSLSVKTYSSGNTYYIGDAIVDHERIIVSYLHNTGEVIKLD